MKSWPLIIFVAIATYVCGDLPYHIYHDKAYIEYYNHSVADNVNLTVHQVGTCQFSLSLIYRTLVEYGDDVIASGDVYRWNGRTWFKIPVDVKKKICDVFKSNMLGPVPFNFSYVAQFGNLTVCNVQKDTVHYLENFVPDMQFFPPKLPFGSYKLNIEFYKDEVLMSATKWYSRVVPSDNITAFPIHPEVTGESS